MHIYRSRKIYNVFGQKLSQSVLLFLSASHFNNCTKFLGTLEVFQEQYVHVDVKIRN